MKYGLIVIICVIIIALLFPPKYSKTDLQTIVDEKLEEHLNVLYGYFEESEYSFNQARDAFNTVYDTIYKEFY